MFAKKAVGLEIDSYGIRFSLVGGKPDNPRLEGWQAAAFPPDTVKVGLRDANVVNAAVFMSTVKNTHLRLLAKSPRVSVSLPDSSGRVMLVDLETRFKTKAEGADLIRWKLKKIFPIDIAETHLDYQVLRQKETGEVVSLVSVISKQVVTQYENLLVDVGLQPNVIDFTSFSLSRLLHRRFELSDNAVLIARYGTSLCIQVFSSGVIIFHRAKDISATIDAQKLFREINSSLLAYRESNPGQKLKEVFFLASSGENESLRGMIAEATGLEPLPVDLDRVIFKNEGLTVDRQTVYSLAASIGAATRNL